VKSLKKGDLVCFTTGNRLLIAEIECSQPFITFKDLLKTCGLRNCLPGCTSLKEGIAAYRSFENYERDEKTHGVVAFALKVRSDLTKMQSIAPPSPALGSNHQAKCFGGQKKQGDAEKNSGDLEKSSQVPSGTKAESTNKLSSSSVAKTPKTEERARDVPEKVAGKPPPSGDFPSAGSAAELQSSKFRGKDKNTLEGSAAIASMQASSSS